MVAISLAYQPATLVLVGCAAAVTGLLPRAAALVSWAALGYVAVTSFSGEGFNLPEWSLSASPLHQLGAVPREDVAALPVVVISALVAGLTAAGLVGMRRRDLTTA